MRNKILVSMRALVICSVLVCCAALLAMLYWVFAGQMDAQMDSYADLLSRNLNLETLTDAQREGIMQSAAQDVRVTLIAPDGSVRFDSHAEIGTMENHIAREEVRQALESGAGESSRMSDTLREQTVYRARLLSDGSVLRIARDRESVFGLVGHLFTFFGTTFLLTSVISMIIATRVTNKIVQPINEIDLKHPENNDVYEELTPLLLRMEHQNRKLESYMRQLEAHRTEFEAITNQMAEGLLVLNDRAEILSMNGAAVRIFGEGERESLIGETLARFSRAEQLHFVAEGALAGACVSEVAQLSGRYYRLIGNPVQRADGISGAVVLAMDVTDAYLNEQSRREFTANVSHELKTPITAVMGYAEIMKNGLVPPEHIGEFSGRIHEEAMRLKRLVENILHLSRLDERKQRQFVPVELRDLAEGAAKHLQPQAAARGVVISIEGGGKVPGVPEELSELIGNLIDNAIKYNRENGRVDVSIYDRDGHICLQVADTGIGIDPAHHDRIFERFFRVDKSHSRQVEGTGLGLSIVKHVVAQHGATLEVTGNPGEGTVFRVIFG